MGDLVLCEDLVVVVLLNLVGFNLMCSVGLVVGGIIIVVFGVVVVFIVNVVSYILLLVLLLCWYL